MLSVGNEVLLLLFFGLGSYIQATTGFAFGLIVMSSVGALGIASIEVTAFAVSVLSFLNASLSLRGGLWRQLNRKAFGYFMLACVPMVFIGVELLEYLGTTSVSLLQLILGACIILSSLLMMLQASKERQASPALSFTLSGVLAGLMGGLFSTFGPPIAYLMYRQPDTMATIRATLLLIFSVTAIIRISMVMGTQTVTTETWLICLTGIPVVVLATTIARRYPPPMAPETLRKCALGLLLLSGASLLIQGVATI